MKSINIIFPNQLFEDSLLIQNNNKTYLIEEYLFFKQYNFHKQKLVFHRSSMKNYEIYLNKKGIETIYIESNNNKSDIRYFLDKTEEKKINIYSPEDNWLEKRIKSKCSKNNIELSIIENPMFINSRNDLLPFFSSEKKKLFQTSFYKNQRKKLNILIDSEFNPKGGKWTYDDMNRKKFPKNKSTPKIDYSKLKSKNYSESVKYVEKNFPNNFGEIEYDSQLYPTDFESSKIWFNNFLKTRFEEFGIYEDAVLVSESIINHSVLSPLLNSGLINPEYIVKCSLNYYENFNTPLNSVEGFVRQIIGWREFIRGVYVCKGTEERNKNYWNFNRKIPKSFYDGSTGIDPVDDTIIKVKNTGYGNHIERLMILGNFMLLCEFDKAITATAPAFSAIFACSAFTTSMMTPPLSISARPFLTLFVDSIFIYLILHYKFKYNKMNFFIFSSKSYSRISLYCLFHRRFKSSESNFVNTLHNESKLLFLYTIWEFGNTLMKEIKSLEITRFPLLTASKSVIPKLSLFVFKAR